MAVLPLLEDLADVTIRREQVFRGSSDFLAHDDSCHLRAVLLEVCKELSPALERQTQRNHAISVNFQI